MYTSDDDHQFVQHDKDNAVPVWSMLDSSNYKTSSNKKILQSITIIKNYVFTFSNYKYLLYLGNSYAVLLLNN